jgi:hypothetical protein
VSPERWQGLDGASNLIRHALIGDDDSEAMATVCGIYRFGRAMSSVILAACRPERFTIADSRALKTLRALSRMPAGPAVFRTRNWPRYLTACRNLAG